MKILYLVHRVPYPPNKGDKIRSHHILRHLSERHEVFLGGFYDDPKDRESCRFLEDFSREQCFIHLDGGRLLRKGPAALLRGRPVTLELFDDRRLRAWVEGLLARTRMDAFFVFSSAMGQYLPPEQEVPGTRRIVDLVDVDSEKWHEYAHKSRVNPVMRFVYRREARLLREYELQLASRADATLLVSEQEASLFRSLAERAGVDLADRVHSMRNGVDLEYYDPDRNYPNPYAEPGAHLVFTGAMDYWANVEGVEWFAREILPRVLEKRRDVRFHIVGSNPDRRVRDLAGRRVEVTGYVEDVRPYLAHADLVVCPLRIARGIQNKVLEAMAMRRPLVATPEALTGIDCEALEHLGTRNAGEFAGHILDLLEDRARARGLADTARRHVEARFGWTASLRRLDRLLEGG